MKSHHSGNAFRQGLPFVLLMLLGGYIASAQAPSFASVLQEALDRYYAANTPLVVDIHFNQPSYAPGDTAWFSASLITEREGLPLGGRQIINVNLTTRTGEVIIRQHILMQDGFAGNQLVIPATLAPGAYTVVAWTEWMENDDPAMYCYRDLIVSGDRLFAPAPMPLAAYPEGGRIVDGVSNRVFVTGRPGAEFAVIRDDQTVTRAMFDERGYGSAWVAGTGRYTVRSGSASVQLPAAMDGVALSCVLSDSTASMDIRLQATRLRDDPCQLVVTAAGKVLYAAMVGFSNGTTIALSLPRRIFPGGVLLVTLFDGSTQVLAERLIVANGPEGAIDVHPSKQACNPRDSIDIDLSTRGIGARPLTVTVYADELFPVSRGASYPFCSRLPFGASAFRTDPLWSLSQWNNFLGTQVWKGFSWGDVWHGSGERLHPFGRYLKLKGKVILPDGESSFDSVRVTFFLRGDPRVYEDYVTGTGEFELLLFFDFDNTEEVFYTIDRKGGVLGDATIELDAKTDVAFSLPAFGRTTVSDPYYSFVSLRDDIRAAYRSYAISADTLAEPDPNALVEDELFEADVTVALDDYVIFPTMEETLREIVPKLQHRWRGRKHTVRVMLSEPDILAVADPLYFVDGVLTDDTDYFMRLSPHDIVTIKVVSQQQKLRVLGILGRNGIVLVTTKIRNNETNVPRTRKTFKATGFTRPLRFSNRIQASARTPVFQSATYFNAMLPVDAQGKATLRVLAPDNLGKFTVEVTGMSTSGTTVVGTTNFDVTAMSRSSPPR